MLSDQDIKNLPEFDNHEQIIRLKDKSSGLNGFIAIHNTNLGPATGGTRRWIYQSEEEAIKDVLNLSRAMTYKCALAGVKFGGGKGVIIANPKELNNELFKAYARQVDKLDGKFTTGPDIGISEAETKIMAAETSYVLGHKNDASKRHSTSDMAALGVFYSMKKAAEIILKRTNMAGLQVAVKGLGKLGGELVRLLVNEGVEVVAADIDAAKVDNIKKDLADITIVPSHLIHTYPVDVYSPCAVGGDLNEYNIKEIKARLIVGGANNQLQTPEVGTKLYKREIFYAPDYAVSAGGLINIIDELEDGGYNPQRVMERVEKIPQTLAKVIELSQKNDTPTNLIADTMAQEIIFNHS